MSTILNKKWKNESFHIERFDSAAEVVKTCRGRQITDSSFKNMETASMGSFEGVKSYDEALDLLQHGYQPTVEAMRGVFKASRNGESKRFAFQNNVQGFAPIVPLALKNVPNSMIDMTMKPIKAKVIDVYYDMTASCGTDSKDIIKAGQNILGAIIELEKQGYRFNLYAMQSYFDNKDADILVVKVKSSDQPIDLKRISFPLTHTAFFRVIGFDWYSKVPGGKYRCAYGRAIAYEHNEQQLNEFAKTVFGKTAVFFSCAKILKKSKEHIKEVMQNGNSKA